MTPPRTLALRAGEKLYATGKPCKAGHVADRYTSSGECTVCERERRARNAGVRQQQAADWYLANKERKLRMAAEWYAANQETAKARKRRWRQENPEACAAHDARRRAAELRALPVWDSELTDFVATEAAGLARQRCAITGYQWDVDHMIPLQAKEACGLHVWSNLQVIPARMNNEKFNRMELTEPGEWVMRL